MFLVAAEATSAAKLAEGCSTDFFSKNRGLLASSKLYLRLSTNEVTIAHRHVD